MKKLTFILAAATLGVLLASQAFAWGPGFGKTRGWNYNRGTVWDELQLTGEQKTKIEALQENHYKATRQLREKIYDKSVEMRKLWRQANPDREQIAAAQQELRALRNEMEDKATALRLDVRAVLTPQQNEKLADLRWSKSYGFGPRHGIRGRGGYGPEFWPGCGGPGFGFRGPMMRGGGYLPGVDEE
jgi:Spy/CpxP family protein refolding chaperone